MMQMTVKKLKWILLSIGVVHCVDPLTASAQISGLTRRIVMSPGPQLFLIPSNAVPARTPAPVTVVRLSTPASPPKSATDRDELFNRTLAFQKQQAEAGSPSFQYALGLRYLSGDGVEKNSETARHWFDLAAKQGNQQASKKMEELNKASSQDR